MSFDHPIPVIEVPEMSAAPNYTPPKFDVVGFTHYLLTALLRHNAGCLHADHSLDAGCWRVRSWSRGAPIFDEVVAESPPQMFRAVLAHFGVTYLNGQIYGGYGEMILVQHDIRHRAAIYMANDQWRGFWLKAYARIRTTNPSIR